MLEHEKNSIFLLNGYFQKSFFDELQKREPKSIFVLEGRPALESSQQTIDELAVKNLSVTLIADNMAGFLFYKNLVKEVWLAFQMTSNDGALCDIGALILGVLAKKHGVPVYLFPSNGTQTKFLGPEKDLLDFKGKRIAPEGVKAYVPLVEWLPKKYITEMYVLNPSTT